MRAFELRNLTNEELTARLDEAKQIMFTLRFQREAGTLEDMSRFKQNRREVARILTVLRERELAAEIAQETDDNE